MNLRGLARKGRHVWPDDPPPPPAAVPGERQLEPEPPADPALAALIAALTAPQTH